MTEIVLRNAPLTLRIAKEALARIAAQVPPNGDDLVAQAYGSIDFKAGVAAFIAGDTPRWTGR